MTSGSYHSSAPTHHQRRHKPDPGRVVQSCQHQVDTLGKRGAYRRTGDLYGISDETVRRYVAAAEAPPAPELPEELAAVPLPGAFPEPEPAATLPQLTPQNDAGERGDSTSSARSNAAISPQVDHATRHTSERAAVAIAEDETPHAPGAPSPPPGQDHEPWGFPDADPDIWPAIDQHEEPHAPGHARPDYDGMGSETPELPPEAFPDPSPNQLTPDMPKTAARYRSGDAPPDPDSRPTPAGPPTAPGGDPTDEYEPLGPETIEQPPLYDDQPSPGPAEPRPFGPDIERIITPNRTVRAPASPTHAAFLARRPIEPMPRLPLRNAGGPWWQTPERGLLGLLVDEEGPYSGRIVALLVGLCLLGATWLG